MAEFLLQGKKYTVDEMSFEAVERAWPYLTEAMANQDPIAGVTAGIAVIAASVMEQDWFKPEIFELEVPTELFENPDDHIHRALCKKMKRMLKSSEIGAIRLCVIEMTKEAGLMPETGEPLPEPVAPLTLGTGTSTELSPNLSQPESKVDAGSV